VIDHRTGNKLLYSESDLKPNVWKTLRICALRAMFCNRKCHCKPLQCGITADISTVKPTVGTCVVWSAWGHKGADDGLLVPRDVICFF